MTPTYNGVVNTTPNTMSISTFGAPSPAQFEQSVASRVEVSDLEQVKAAIDKVVRTEAARRFEDFFLRRPQPEKRLADQLVYEGFIRFLNVTAEHGFARHPDWPLEARFLFTAACIEEAAHMQWPAERP